MIRLWNDTSNNLDAFSDKDRCCAPNLKEFISHALGRLKSKGSKFMDDVEYRWMASRFLLFYDDNYLSLGLLDKSQENELSLCCPKTVRIPDHLERVICTTALTIPDLKKEAEDIMKLRKNC
uniref:Uncharacterized protein n=1 Tax=Ditylenchus dipsaci TaxID=166011 RepID=A0A915D1R6_9BILA